MARDARGNLVPDAQAQGTRITSQQESIGLGTNGRATSGYIVSFQTAKGVQGSVFVETRLYTPQNVLAAVAQHASQLDQVQDTVL